LQALCPPDGFGESGTNAPADNHQKKLRTPGLHTSKTWQSFTDPLSRLLPRSDTQTVQKIQQFFRDIGKSRLPRVPSIRFVIGFQSIRLQGHCERTNSSLQDVIRHYFVGL
jgi:hypothetical protein